MTTIVVNAFNDALSATANTGDYIHVKSTDDVYLVTTRINASSSGISRTDGKVLVWDSKSTSGVISTEVDSIESKVGGGIKEFDPSETYNTNDQVIHDGRVLLCKVDNVTGPFTSNAWDVLVGPVYGNNPNRFKGVKSLVIEMELFDDSIYTGLKWLKLKDYNGNVVNPTSIQKATSNIDMIIEPSNYFFFEAAMEKDYVEETIGTIFERLLWNSGDFRDNIRNTIRVCYVFPNPIDIHTIELKTSAWSDQNPRLVKVYGSEVDVRAMGIIDFIKEPWLKLMGSLTFSSVGNPSTGTIVSLNMESAVVRLPRFRTDEDFRWEIATGLALNSSGGSNNTHLGLGYMPRNLKVAAVAWLSSRFSTGQTASFTFYRSDGKTPYYGMHDTGNMPITGRRFTTSGTQSGFSGGNEKGGGIIDIRNENLVVPNDDAYCGLSFYDSSGNIEENSTYLQVSTPNSTRIGFQNRTFYNNNAIVQGSTTAFVSDYNAITVSTVIYEV